MKKLYWGNDDEARGLLVGAISVHCTICDQGVFCVDLGGIAGDMRYDLLLKKASPGAIKNKLKVIENRMNGFVRKIADTHEQSERIAKIFDEELKAIFVDLPEHLEYRPTGRTRTVNVDHEERISIPTTPLHGKVYYRVPLEGPDNEVLNLKPQSPPLWYVIAMFTICFLLCSSLVWLSNITPEERADLMEHIHPTEQVDEPNN